MTRLLTPPEYASAQDRVTRSHRRQGSIQCAAANAPWSDDAGYNLRGRMTRKAVRTFPSVATLVVIASISAGVADDADDAEPQADAAANEDVPPITIRLQAVQPRAAFESLFKQVELELPKEWENHWTTT